MKTNHSRTHSILMTMATTAFALLFAQVNTAFVQDEPTASDSTNS